MKLRHLTMACLPLISLLFVACGHDSDDDDPTASEEAIKSNHVAMAFASYSDSLSAAQDLQSAVNVLIASPSETALEDARAAYKAARVPYQQSEIMRWDTAITLNNDLSADGGPASVDEWEGQVNAWPLDENHIVSLIQGSEEINSDLLIAQNGEGGEANVTTGVHAVEFMLWGQDLNGTGPGAGMRPFTDFANDGSCADAFCERRAAYLKTATDLLVADLTEMVAEWSPQAETTQGTLAYNFLNSNLALDYIVGSMVVMATDELASARMGAGLTLGDPEEEHDCFSDLSHVAIYYNFQAVRNAFYGRYADVSGASLADLVRSKNSATFQTLDAAFNSIEEKMLALYELGERDVDPIKFDQIIGQGADGAERQLAEAASAELVALNTEFLNLKELLSLVELSTDGSGDGD